MGPHNLTKFQTDTIILTPSKVAIAEAQANKNSITSICVRVKVRIEVKPVWCNKENVPI